MNFHLAKTKVRDTIPRQTNPFVEIIGTCVKVISNGLVRVLIFIVLHLTAHSYGLY